MDETAAADPDNSISKFSAKSVQRNNISGPLAICERCHYTGTKAHFFSRLKRYCSVQCFRALPSPNVNVNGAKKKKMSTVTGGGYLSNSYDWRDRLNEESFRAAPVSCFPFAPLSPWWASNVTVGMKVEVENHDVDTTGIYEVIYWIASVIKVSGYMALLRYEGYDGSSCDFWMNLCVTSGQVGRDDPRVHYIGYAASHNAPLMPPRNGRREDWQTFLVDQLTGAVTLPENFHDGVLDVLRPNFPVSTKLEVVDKRRISAVRVATVIKNVGGRMLVRYQGDKSENDEFWCHERSPLVHPVGWARVVGHELIATDSYSEESIKKALSLNYEPNEASWRFFPKIIMSDVVLEELSSNGFKPGLKLEAIDPLNLSTICVATVHRVLRHNYIMVGIDGHTSPNGSDLFCYHATSPCIFPVGFCERNNIELTPPPGYQGQFSWRKYLDETGSQAAPFKLFKRYLPDHGFEKGMWIEAVDLMEPRLICVAQITRVVGRLLRVHFEGWEESYDQWLDCESPDIFPVGWCEMVGYPLEPPRAEGVGNDMVTLTGDYAPNGTTRKKRYFGANRNRRKRKSTSSRAISSEEVSGTNNLSPLAGEEPSQDGGVDDVTFGGEEEEFPPLSPLDAGDIGVFSHKETGLKFSVKFHSNTVPVDWDKMACEIFLRINSSENCVWPMRRAQVLESGRDLLSLTKEVLVAVPGMKVGPSLRLSEMIRLLGTVVAPPTSNNDDVIIKQEPLL